MMGLSPEDTTQVDGAFPCVSLWDEEVKELFLLSQHDWLRGAAIQSEAQSHPPRMRWLALPQARGPLLRTAFGADVNPSPGFPVAGLIVCEVYTKIPAFAYFGLWEEKKKKKESGRRFLHHRSTARRPLQANATFRGYVTAVLRCSSRNPKAALQSTASDA